MNAFEAYDYGYFFCLGYLYAKNQKLAFDDDQKKKFRTTENNQTIYIEKGEITGGAGSHVGKDALPSLDFFLEGRTDLKTASYTKKVTAYLKAHYAGKTIKNPAGLKGCKELKFSVSGLKETAAHMNKEKEEILPCLAYIYRTGTYLGSSADYHDDKSTTVIHYTRKILKLGKKFYRVTVVSKQAGKGVADFSHYAIDKADKIYRKEKG